MKSLTISLKQKFLPRLIHRDGGFKCFYCNQILSSKRFSFDHLNNNRTDNRLENLVLCHQSCNIKKISYLDYQIIAKEKLRKNEEEFSGREEKNPNTHFDYTSEIGINIGTYDIVESYLKNETTTDGHVLFNDALYSIVYLCKQKMGHGSEQAVRRHLNTLTSSVAPYLITRNESNQKIIVGRPEN